MVRLASPQEDRARSLHHEAIIITCHDHIPTPVDLPELQAGGITAKFALMGADAWLDAPSRDEFLASIQEYHGWCKKTLLSFERMLTAIEGLPADLLQVRSAADVLRAKREGRVGILLGSEGGKLIEGRLELLRVFHRLGLRQMQLTWAYTNQLSAGETELDSLGACDGYFFSEHLQTAARGEKVRGLTDLGRQVIAEMNRLG
ncbi:MAG TPA: membrane dipeptidase, partial [Anaerolineae bacterium]|nr:membrane dipeptidase [Anaerolineae bacterium]